ncbi:endonuclease/exonuclease/phosphatase family domain-containing protein 1-like [Dreissena polymorpha]|uniref:endonuclease/exonuclease/phosphatase family domain-containing protein 1-like n=1 Tax=Dreissena polymorpha TaxID=45954 RepID=UPI0022653AE9|nr:endonuclease/exonuclease/phosphatase family domain-containing protein 1-like [Dreissena polymorpha]
MTHSSLHFPQICDELNTPTLPNNQKWAGHRGKWKCVISESTGRMYMSNEYNGFLYDEMQGVVPVSSTLLAMDKKQKQKPFTRRPCIATFKISGFDCALVSVHLKATGLENEDIGRLQAEIDNIPNLIETIRTALPAPEGKNGSLKDLKTSSNTSYVSGPGNALLILGF